jgi:hypothetical protein
MFAESRSVARLLLFTLVTVMLVPAPLGTHHATPNSGPASSMRCTIPILGAGGIRHGVLIYEASSPPVGSAHFSFGVLFNESLRPIPSLIVAWSSVGLIFLRLFYGQVRVSASPDPSRPSSSQ